MLRQDLTYAFRALRRNRGTAAAVALTLTLGIGTATATLSLVSGILLRPLPVRNQDQLVGVRAENRTRPDTHVGLTFEILERLDTMGALAEVAPFLAPVNPTRADPAAVRAGERVTALAVTLVAGDFFRVLGVVPAAGRLLAPADAAPGAPGVAVLSYRAWQREFGGDPQVVGQTLVFRGAPHTVVGIAPEGFTYPTGSELWSTDAAVFGAAGEVSADDGYFDLVARLRPGVTPTQAAAAITTVLRGATSPRLGPPEARVAVVRPLAEFVVGDLRPGLLVLAGAVALLLLIVWVNVAGLLVTRGLARAPELAVRAALGAGRGRLVAQLLTEHAVLAIVGGVLGTALAAVLLRVAQLMAPPDLPRLDTVRVDGAMLAVAILITLLSVLAIGVIPAVGAVRRDVASALRAGSRALTDGARHRRTQHAVVVGQVALAFVVLVGAGLLGRSLAELQRLDLGFEPERLLFVVLGGGLEAGVAIPSPAEQEARRQAVVNVFADGLPTVPGVLGATAAYALPFSGAGPELTYTIEGRPADAAEQSSRAALHSALDDFVPTLGLRLVRGRAFTPADGAGAAPVVVVSEALAEHAWPGQDPLGQRIRLGRRDSTWRTVVGVVGDTRYRALAAAPRPAIYRPLRQDPNAGHLAAWAVRTAGEPMRMLPTVRRLLHAADPDAGIQFAASGRALLAEPLWRPRLLATLLAALSIVSMLLAAVGLFGTLAAVVRQDAHPIAVRMALGATPRTIRVRVVRQAVFLVGGGALVGLAVALGATRPLSAVLFEVSPLDPWAAAGAAGVLFAVAAVAALLPVRRAGRVDPLAVLRGE